MESKVNKRTLHVSDSFSVHHQESSTAHTVIGICHIGTAISSQIYFWNKTLHVSDSFSVHHQESSTAHTEIGICHTASGIRIPLASSEQNLYDIYILLCV